MAWINKKSLVILRNLYHIKASKQGVAARAIARGKTLGSKGLSIWIG